MSCNILDKITAFDNVIIQCHNNPDADALACALALQLYLKRNNKNSRIVYGGHEIITKKSLRDMMKVCEIEAEYIKDPDEFVVKDTDLLVVVDAQYGAKNVAMIKAKNVAVIDHHIRTLPESDYYYIDSSYQSCSTIMWELLVEKGYTVSESKQLEIALGYGLYIDTSCFADLHNKKDLLMRTELKEDYPELLSLKKSNMNMSELMVAADAIYNHFMDFDRKYVIVSALKCSPSILGIIGDFIIQVDTVHLTFTYTDVDTGYQFSIRTCEEKYHADEIAATISDGIGGGGGHRNKAGGTLAQAYIDEKYPGWDIHDIIVSRLNSYIDNLDKDE